MEVWPPEYDVLDQRVCATCGYDLRGQVETRCPECGTSFDPGALPVPDIPWVQRANTDALGAYGATVAWVLRNPRAAARTIGTARVYTERASQRFRRAIVWQAAVSTMLFISAALMRAIGDASAPGVAWAMVLGSLSGPGAALFFWGAANPHMLPREWWKQPILPDRAGALHNFAMAPVALLPLATLVEFASLFLDFGQQTQTARHVHDAAVLAYAGLIFLWAAVTVVMMHASRIWDARELAAAALLMSARWVILAMFVVMMTFLLAGCVVVPLNLLSRG